MLDRVFVLAFLALVVHPDARAQDVRIGVLGLFHPRELTLQASRQEAVIIHAAGQALVLGPGSSTTAFFHISDDMLVLDIGGLELRAAEIHATSRNGGAVSFHLGVPGKIVRGYRGTLVVKSSRGEVVPIITMDIETAVASTVEAESAPGTPLEALKAQAVVARSYFVAGGGRHRDFDFCDLTHCQFLREPPAQTSSAAIATRETRGIVLTFLGKPFAPMFSRSCGGRTRTPADVGLPGSAYPYFSVLCDFCHKSPYRWSRKLSLTEAAPLFGQGESGRLVVDRSLGWNAVPSNSFTSREENGEVVLEGAGQGHGIGLCQRGAKALAEEGSSLREILDHYFPNTALTQLAQSGVDPMASFQAAQKYMFAK